MHCGGQTVMHEPWCPQKAFKHTDAAKRVADIYNLHRIGRGLNAVGKWVAVALSDGHSDDTLYDSKRDAVIHQRHNEKYYAFVCITPSDMKVCEAEVVLRKNRELYDKGLRWSDPDHKHGGPEVIKRLTVEDELASIRGRATNLIFPWELEN